MTPDELREQLELEIVELIKAKMDDGSMTEERAQQVSQAVLSTIVPGMSFEELYRAIPKLDDHCPELSPVIIPILRDYEQNVTKQVEANVRELIRQGQFDAASKLAENALSGNVNLVWQGSGKPT